MEHGARGDGNAGGGSPTPAAAPHATPGADNLSSPVWKWGSVTGYVVLLYPRGRPHRDFG